MQSGTVGAYPLPFKRQVAVSSNRTLSTLELNGLIVVDSSNGPVEITLPFANTIRAGGFFQILALNADINPVTVIFQGGNTYNDGQVAPITIDQAGQSLLVLGTEAATTWLAILDSGGVGTANCLTQFLVSPNPAGAPFQLIQAAYDAAFAAGGGTVLVCDGTYIEDLILTGHSVDIVHIAENSQQAPAGRGGDGNAVLVGRIIIDLLFNGSRDATTLRWQGIDIRPPAGTPIIISGPNNAASYTYVTDCQIISPDSAALLMSNTGVAGGLATVLDVQRCTLDTPDGIVAAGGPAPFPSLLLKNCSLTVPDGPGFILSEMNYSLDSCIVSHGFDDPGLLTADSVGQADDTIWQGGEAPHFLLGDATSVLRVLDNKFVHDPDTPFLITSGSFLHDALVFIGTNVPPWLSAGPASVTTEQAVPHEAYALTILLDGAAHILSTETNVLGESTAAGGVLVLPPTAERAGPIRMKLSLGNIGGITVAAQGADTIRLPGAAPAAAVPLTDPGFVLVSNPVTGRWEGWS